MRDLIDTIKLHRGLLIFSFIIMLSSFAFNVFAVGREGWFSNYQKDSEALVVYKLACEEANAGDFGGMLARVKEYDGNSNQDFASLTRNPICPASNLDAYYSQYGLQGKIAQIGYDVTSKTIGFSVTRFVQALQLLWAAALALVLSLFVIWTAKEHGRATGVMVAVLLSLSTWLVGFAPNLYWATALFFLPFVFTLYAYQPMRRSRAYLLFLLGLSLLFLVRFLCGYEYTPEIILSPVCAMLYMSLKRGSNLANVAREALIICGVGAIAFVVAIGMNYQQVYSHVGDYGKAFEIIKERVVARTSDASTYEGYAYAGLWVTLPEVYSTINSYVNLEAAAEQRPALFSSGISALNYALLPVVSLPFVIREPLNTIITSFAMFTMLSLFAWRAMSKRLDTKEDRHDHRALGWVLLAAFATSVSWLVLAHSHSLVHAHINGVIFYMPFMLFAYIVIAKYLVYVVRKYVTDYRRPQTKGVRRAASKTK